MYKPSFFKIDQEEDEYDDIDRTKKKKCTCEIIRTCKEEDIKVTHKPKNCLKSSFFKLKLSRRKLYTAVLQEWLDEKNKICKSVINLHF